MNPLKWLQIVAIVFDHLFAHIPFHKAGQFVLQGLRIRVLAQQNIVFGWTPGRCCRPVFE
jgi:hypothetical protein